MADTVLTAAQNGSRTPLAVGEHLSVVLPENPSTGYRWSVESSGSLEAADDAYASAASPQQAGGGGLRTFRFSAVRPGEVRLVLKLSRPWGGESSVVQRFEATVSVGPAPG